MSNKVFPNQLSALTSRELRELQKLHEVGKKYWVSEITCAYVWNLRLRID